MTTTFEYLRLIKKTKHGKVKHQTEVKVPVQVIWENRNKNKDLFKICVLILNSD